MNPEPTDLSNCYKGTYFADLSSCTYFGWDIEAGEKIKAVGWLSPDHPFSKGTVSDVHFHSLLRLFVNLWQPCQFLGGQSCEFCGPHDLSRRTEYSPDSRFVARRRISDGVETFEILGPETEIFKRKNSYNPDVLEIHLGVSNLFVPADNFVFAAPSLILHYIHGHGYDPPSSFWDAVMASSRLSFEDYKEALIRNGLLEALKLKRKRPR
jgi:hypothetical protein